jgi:hypothetical protein
MLILPIFFIAFVLQLVLPWWIIGIIAFGMAYWQAKSAGQAFRGGFVSIVLLWLVMSLWHSLPNENLLANRVGQMLMLPDWPFTWILVVLTTCMIGGLAAGFAAWSGYLVRSAWFTAKTKK